MSQAHPDRDVAMDAESVRAPTISEQAVNRGLREHGRVLTSRVEAVLGELAALPPAAE